MSPSWSDDEGRCHFEVDGVPCYQSSKGCPMHRAEPASLRRHRKERLYTRAEMLEYGRALETMWIERAYEAARHKPDMQFGEAIALLDLIDLAALLDEVKP